MAPPLRPPISIHEFKAWQRRVEELERVALTSVDWQKEHSEEFEVLKQNVSAMNGKLDLLVQASHNANLKAGVWGGGLGSLLWVVERIVEFLSRSGG